MKPAQCEQCLGGDSHAPRVAWVLTLETVEERLLKLGMGNADAGGEV